MTEHPCVETIAAIATPPGRGGIGVVRVSGPLSPEITRRVAGTVAPPRTAILRFFHDAERRRIDQGIVLRYQAPRSYTGEDMVEFQGHGGPVVMDMLLNATIHAGARLARPGEFTQRAFLNGKLDLSQSEAVADLIASQSEAAVRAAQRTVQGELARQVAGLANQITVLRAYVESTIDFSDQALDFIVGAEIGRRLEGIDAELRTLLESTANGTVLREGLRAVIAGAPNVGKSSLLNRLSTHDTAIVSEIPGTTRDLLQATFNLDGLPVELTDTAGLHRTADPIEREGIRRAEEAFALADLVLLIVDDRSGLDAEVDEYLGRLQPATTRILVRNKIDLSGEAAGAATVGGQRVLRMSALTGDGVDMLREEIKAAAAYRVVTGSVFLARRRHVEALERARTALTTARASQLAVEVVAEELRSAQRALAEISGEKTSDDLLEQIFSTFCIGK